MTPYETRVQVAKALTMLYRTDHWDQSDDRIAIHTEDFSDETCALVVTAIGTDYEKPVLELAHGGFHDQLMGEFVRQAPLYGEDGQYALANYFRQLYRYREREVTHFGYSAAHFRQLIISAVECQDATGVKVFPATTEEEALVITLAMTPSRLEVMLDRFDQDWNISPEVLEQLATAAPSLVDGVL